MKMLIAEDHATVAALFKRLLEKTGMRICSADTTSTLAETLARTKAEPPHMIILDLILHDSGAHHTIATIPELDAHAPVVVLTGAPLNETTLLECFRRGAMAVLDKPTFLRPGNEAYLANAIFTARQNWKRIHDPA